MNFESILYSLAALFDFILILFIIQKLIRNRKTGPKVTPDFFNEAPFEVAFAVDSKMRVIPYEELVPNFCIGFDNKVDAHIEVSQTALDISTPENSERRFELSIALLKLNGCEWITLERTTKNLLKSDDYKITLTVQAKGSTALELNAQICIPQINEQDRNINLGKLSLNSEYNCFTFSQSVGGDLLANVDELKNSRVIIFLPTENETVIDFKQFSVEFEAYRQNP